MRSAIGTIIDISAFFAHLDCVVAIRAGCTLHFECVNPSFVSRFGNDFGNSFATSNADALPFAVLGAGRFFGNGRFAERVSQCLLHPSSFNSANRANLGNITVGCAGGIYSCGFNVLVGTTIGFYKVEISVVLALRRLGGLLNLNVVISLLEFNLNTKHIGRHCVVVFTSCKCILIGCKLEGRFEGVLIIGTLVNGVLCTTFLVVLHSQVNSHFVNACLGNSYLNGEEFTMAFGYVPVADFVEDCGRYVRGGLFRNVVACPNVVHIITCKLFGDDGSKVEGIIQTVAVVVIYGCVFEYRNVSANFAATVNNTVFGTRDLFTAYCASVSNIGMTPCRSIFGFSFATDRTGTNFLTVQRASGRLGLCPFAKGVTCRKSELSCLSTQRANTGDISICCASSIYSFGFDVFMSATIGFYKVEISKVLIFSCLGIIYNFDCINTLLQFKSNTEHIRGYVTQIITSCNFLLLACKLEGDFKAIFTLSSFVNNVLRTTVSCIALQSRMDS